MKRPSTVVRDREIMRLRRSGQSVTCISISLGISKHQVYHGIYRTRAGKK